jgi:AraC-like DNA-binding protein
MAFGQGVSVWVLDAPNGLGVAEYHAHHAIQITAALQGELALSTSEYSLSAPVLAVGADVRHRIDASGLLAFVFVEPESRAGRALSETLLAGRDIAKVAEPRVEETLAPLRGTFAADLTRKQLLDVGRAVIELLSPRTEPPLPDPRIQRIIEYASNHLDQPLTLTAAAQGIYLSPSRLRHLFVEQTGVAFKTYLLWLRLIRAVQIYSQGQGSLTEAAHAAGFADSAHFSRVFKRTFGSPATSLPRI